MAIWDDVISDEERRLLEKAGFGKRKAFGQSPALAVIDVVTHFVGDKPEPIAQSIERFPLSCGEAGWRAVRQIGAILPVARSLKIPIIYSTGDTSLPAPWLDKKRDEEVRAVHDGNEIVGEIAPHPGDIVIRKHAPSIFFGTPLIGILMTLSVDTLVCCGGVTSGCVKASVVDAASYGLRVGVIEECTFDRIEICHKVNLFDMGLKYAKVISVADFLDYLKNIQDT